MSNKKSENIRQQDQFEDNCHYLGLKLLARDYRSLIDNANEKDPGYYDFIRAIVQDEASHKMQRRKEYLVKNSRLPFPLKILADFDFDFQPGLNRKLILDLATLGFIERNESILFLGDNGTGKSHLARSLAMLACQRGTVQEQDWPEFIGDPVSTRAILERIFHHSVIVKIDGPSYRKHQGERLQEKYGRQKTSGQDGDKP
jgi:DNA replication protein DnaC